MSNWHFGYVAAALLVGMVLQIIWLPCLCSIGKAKRAFAGMVDVLIILRILMAYFTKEESNGWKAHSILALSSFAWIDVVSRIMFGWH